MTEVFNKLSIIYLITDNCVKSKKYKVFHDFKNRLQSISGVHFDFSRKKKKIYRLLLYTEYYLPNDDHYDYYLQSNSIKQHDIATE